jgi:hypothetical protein
MKRGQGEKRKFVAPESPKERRALRDLEELI